MKSLVRVLAALPLVALAACSGNAVVTMTATPATALASGPSALSGFLAYRVKLVSITVVEAKGGSTVSVLPHPVSIDLAQITSLSEVLTDAVLKKGDYTRVALTLDYTDAVIVADNGTAAGLTLTPQAAGGKALGPVTLTVTLDPSNPLSISTGSTSQLALDFRLASSNVVDTAAGTVTVTPVVVASSAAIDTKTVRLRGYLRKTDSSASTYSAGIEPADGLVTEGGSIGVAPSTTTLYEVNGVQSTGDTTGFSALAALSPGAWTIAYGTLTTSTSTQTSAAATTSTGTTVGGLLGSGTTGTTTSTVVTNLSFTPTQVLAGTSVQGGGLDVVAGVVTARSGNVVTVPTATWISNGGVPTFLSGTATITLGTNTVVLTPTIQSSGVLGNANTEAQVSVGSTITAYGTTTSAAGGNLSLDASNGRVRLQNSVAAGDIVVDSILDQVTLNLASLSGRQIGAFDFSNTGVDPTNYLADAPGLDLGSQPLGAPISLTGLVESFGTTTYDFLESAAADASAIDAELVLDWGGSGTTTPFAAISSSELDLPLTGVGAGSRHQITVGPTAYPLPTLTSDVLIVPSTASTLLYSIAHLSTSTVENFNTFAAFATALNSALDGKAAALSMTAEGLFAVNGTTFTATGIIVSLNN
jgi:hypothetical protein